MSGIEPGRSTWEPDMLSTELKGHLSSQGLIASLTVWCFALHTANETVQDNHEAKILTIGKMSEG